VKNTSEVGSPEVVNNFLEESPKIKLRHLLALMVRGVCVYRTTGGSTYIHMRTEVSIARQRKLS